LFERNCGCVIPRKSNDDDDSTKFTAQFLERQSICIKLVENISYMLIDITRGLQTRMERPEAVLPFDLSAANGRASVRRAISGFMSLASKAA